MRAVWKVFEWAARTVPNSVDSLVEHVVLMKAGWRADRWELSVAAWRVDCSVYRTEWKRDIQCGSLWVAKKVPRWTDRKGSQMVERWAGRMVHLWVESWVVKRNGTASMWAVSRVWRMGDQMADHRAEWMAGYWVDWKASLRVAN